MTTKLRAVTLALAGLATALPARAETSGGPPREWAGILKMKAMDAMHLMDEGGKGYVTKDEFLEFQRRFFERMDRDHDGKVSAEEWLGHPPGPDDR
jgi:hypothetical protein